MITTLQKEKNNPHKIPLRLKCTKHMPLLRQEKETSSSNSATRPHPYFFNTPSDGKSSLDGGKNCTFPWVHCHSNYVHYLAC